MRRAAKIKTSTRTSMRKTATSATAAARRGYPAWVDASEGPTVIGTTRTATPRVRDGLVLRTVTKKSAERRVPHGPGSR